MKRFSILVILLLNIISMAHANERGLFWQLKAPNGSTHYLFGTIHTDDNRIIKFLPVVKKSVSQSDLLLESGEKTFRISCDVFRECHQNETLAFSSHF
jgi:uncharacterized protein YbaP (TraB family)